MHGHDVVVIGGGPGGYRTAVARRASGRAGCARGARPAGRDLFQPRLHAQEVAVASRPALEDVAAPQGCGLAGEVRSDLVRTANPLFKPGLFAGLA